VEYMEEKSIQNNKIKIEDILRIEQEYILYLEDYTIEQISQLTGNSCETIQKDLLITLKELDQKIFNQLDKSKIKKKR
jgi:hypothetical protein